MKRLLGRILPVLTVVAIGFAKVEAETFTVTRTNVTGPGSLPVIVNQANATPGDNVIEFAVIDPIVLVSALPPITNNVTINGRVDVPTVISGGGTVPIFTFAAGTTSILSRLVLTNAHSAANGAAISSGGTVFLSDCRLLRNQAPAGGGAAIENTGMATLVNCELSGNYSAFGGAILNSGLMKLATSNARENQAGIGNGGAIVNTGSLMADRISLLGNVAALGFGGAVYSSGPLVFSASTLSSNSALGAAFTYMGSPGMGYGGGGGGGGGLGAGGGLYIAAGTAELTNCTLYANTAVGGNGLKGGGSTCLESSPASNWGGIGGGGGGGGGSMVGFPGGNGGFGGGKGGNGGGEQTAGNGGDGGSGIGAGAFVQGGSLDLVNCTITANSSVAGSGGPGGEVASITCGLNSKPLVAGSQGQKGQAVAGGVFNYAGTIRLVNTIIDGNTASASSDIAGIVVSSGVNLVGDSQGATGLSVNDFQNVPANLGPLQDNGGPAYTCALLQGSLAIGAGTSTGAPLADQRGVARPPGKSDIGAFQLVTVITPVIEWSEPSDIVYGTALGQDQLNASVGVAGKITYTPAPGTVLSAGPDQVLQVVFTPNDPIQYTGATNSVSINVLKTSQSISFAPIPNHQIGDPPILLNASASSGLPVIFKVQSGPSTITENLLSFGSSDGQVTIAAIQNGDNNHEPIEADQSFYLGTIPLPVITSQPIGQSVYPGDRTAFTVSAANGPLSYRWQFFGADIPGGTEPTLVLARVQAAQAGPYRVIVTNPSGSVTSTVANLSVVVSQGTAKIIQQPQSQTVRLGENTTLSVLATGDGPLQYQWYRGQSGDTAGIIPGANDPTYMASGLSADTTCWVSVRNALGSVDSSAAGIRVFPANAARLALSFVSGLPGLVIDGASGTTYRIEYATDPKAANWTRLIDLSLSSSPFTFIDSGALNKARFYRVLVP